VRLVRPLGRHGALAVRDRRARRGPRGKSGRESGRPAVVVKAEGPPSPV